MALFKRKEKVNKIDEAFSKVYSQIDSIDSWEDPKKLQHYILDSCEQIIATTKSMEHAKGEYRVVTEYIKDVDTLTKLEGEPRKNLYEVAAHILELERSIDYYSTVKREITDEQFSIIAENEDDMPGVINRMKTSEALQSKIKRNMDYMSGEKSRWEIERDDNKRRQLLIKKLGLAILSTFFAVLILLLAIANNTDADVSVFMLVIMILGALAAFIIFVRQSDIKKKNKKDTYNLNHVIGLLNVEKMKYVNVTNGIEYTKDKYSVESAAQLEYVWGQYMEAVRDRERFISHNDDLEYFNGRLERILEGIELYDRKIWINQLGVLINPHEMAELKHKLVQRRKKIRTLIEESQQMAQKERNEIDRLMDEHQHYIPELKEIIESVDKICGTKSMTDM